MSRYTMWCAMALLTATGGCRPTREEQVASCRAARAAYGNDIGACGVIRYGWNETEAALQRLLDLRRESLLGLKPADRVAALRRDMAYLISQGVDTASARSTFQRDSLEFMRFP